MRNDKNISELELAALCSKGDRSARRELYTRYAARVVALCARYAGDRYDPEDLMHDAMVEVFSSIGHFKYRGEGSLFSWISAVAVNTTVDLLRKEGRLSLVELADNNEVEAVDEDERVRIVPISVLSEIINTLPDVKRLVFNMFCIDNMSHRQIAERLGITERASSSMLSKAKRILSARIEEYMKERKDYE